MAGKPSVKVYGKKKQNAAPELPAFLDLAAFWVNDDGRLSGQWSRDIVKIRVKDRDGKVHDLDAAALGSYFCNLRDDREMVDANALRAAANRRQAQKPADAAPPSFDAAPDFGDDDIPFAVPYTTPF